MKVSKETTKYGAKITEFADKIGKFSFKFHVFEKTGDIAYEIRYNNRLVEFKNFASIQKLKKSLEFEEEKLKFTKLLINKINKLDRNSKPKGPKDQPIIG